MKKQRSVAAPAEPSNWVSVPEAARLLDCTRNTIYNRIARGELVADHVAGRLLVRKSSLVDHQKEKAIA